MTTERTCCVVNPDRLIGIEGDDDIAPAAQRLYTHLPYTGSREKAGVLARDRKEMFQIRGFSTCYFSCSALRPGMKKKHRRRFSVTMPA